MRSWVPYRPVEISLFMLPIAPQIVNGNLSAVEYAERGGLLKAAEDSRTPRPSGNICALENAPASWSAAVLCRFLLRLPRPPDAFSRAEKQSCLARELRKPIMRRCSTSK